jgi:hypothetical protein
VREKGRAIALARPGERRLLIVTALSILTLSLGQSRSALEARFIGNMAYAVSAGATTMFTDFPYESGYRAPHRYLPPGWCRELCARMLRDMLRPQARGNAQPPRATRLR